MYKTFSEADVTLEFESEFREALTDEIEYFSDKEIIGFLIKKLSSADVISTLKKGNTTHIAYTTKSRFFFKEMIYEVLINHPDYISLEGSRINYKFPIDIIDPNNYLQLGKELVKSSTVFWVNDKGNGDHQIGISKEKYNDNNFNKYREIMETGDYLIFVKIEGSSPDEFSVCSLLIKSNNDNDLHLLDILEKNYKRIKFTLPANIQSYLEINDTEEIKNNNHSIVGKNKIIYGAPGTGKSHTVKESFEKAGFYERVTFHPEYTFNDFIGSIKPQVKEGNISYEFEAGPFTTLLEKAINDKNGNHYYLIIEEINRANAPAVFGDLFQLLDREDDGTSTYEVTNFDIANWVHGNKEKKIKLPNNLSIIATMNSADQNVFVMDTAFKRRWDFKYLPIDFKNCKFQDTKIEKLNCTWKQFVTTLNNYLLDLREDGIEISEDKLLGPWFIKENLLNNEEIFASKILYYLWDDVLKVDKETIFNQNIKSFVDILNMYTNQRIDGLNIFNEKFRKLIIEIVNENSKQQDVINKDNAVAAEEREIYKIPTGDEVGEEV